MSVLTFLAGLAALSCLAGIPLWCRKAQESYYDDRPYWLIFSVAAALGQMVACFIFMMMFWFPL